MHLTKLSTPLMALLSLALAHPIAKAQSEDLCSRDKWEELMFRTSKPQTHHNRPSPQTIITNIPSPNPALETFTLARRAQSPSCFNWTSDGCTKSPDKPGGFDFLPACHRHDFGDIYLKTRGEWIPENKLKVDDMFREDMFSVCEKKEGLEKGACRGLAEVYRNTTGWYNEAEDGL